MSESLKNSWHIATRREGTFDWFGGNRRILDRDDRWSIDDQPRADLVDEMTRMNERPTRDRGLMGIVAHRLFGGERGESKWGITSIRLRVSAAISWNPLDPDNPWVRNHRFARFTLIECMCILTVLYAPVYKQSVQSR